MENRKHSKVFVFHSLIKLSFLVLLYPLNQNFTAGAIPNQISTSSAVQPHHTYDELNLGNRMSEIEIKHRHQENEIGILKTLRVEDKKMINQLRDRVDQLESKVESASTNEKILERQKRPFRLAPVNYQREKESDPHIIVGEGHVDHVDMFKGPATSCDELGMIGYTLNGYYLVKAKTQSIDSSHKIEVVYCQFYQPLGLNHRDTEKRLGHLNVKSSSDGIYFTVGRHGNLPTAINGIIRFNKELLNIGGAMNLSTGVFTAPKAGIYYFSFSINKNGYSFDNINIYLRLNGIKVGFSSVGAGLFTAPATIQFTLKLKKGDRIDLWKPSSGTLGYQSTELCHFFTGYLLDEDLLV